MACPECRSPDLTLETRRTEQRPVTRGHFTPDEGEPPGVNLANREETEILEGAIHCSACASSWPIVDGIPRMLGAEDAEGPRTAHRWTTFDSAVSEWEENFLDLASPLQPGDFLGKVVLDAGCGYGRHAYFAARYGAEVIALDSSGDAVAATATNTRDLGRVHVMARQSPEPTEQGAIVGTAARGSIHQRLGSDARLKHATPTTQILQRHAHTVGNREFRGAVTAYTRL